MPGTLGIQAALAALDPLAGQVDAALVPGKAESGADREPEFARLTALPQHEWQLGVTHDEPEGQVLRATQVAKYLDSHRSLDGIAGTESARFNDARVGHRPV